MNYFTHRRNSLLRDLKKDNLDALLITQPVNVTYLTGFMGDSSYFVLTAKHAILVSDDRFSQQVREECPDLEVHIRPHNKTTPEAAGEVLTKLGAKAVGVEADHMTMALAEAFKEYAPKSTLAPVRGAVEALRALKDASEVEAIKAAIRVAERAFVMFKSTLRETETERDMVAAVENFVRRAGGDCTAFPPIVAVGERGALPHAPPTTKPLNDGSKLLVDWGAVLNGYRSDLTRTLKSPFEIAPTRRNKSERVGYNFEKIHDIVLKAQDAAIKTVREGVPAKDVDAAARKVITDAGYGEYFTHGLGHGIGLETHEAPRVRQNSTDTLESGMVITIEPGIYIPGWGGVRIEDDVLVRRDGGLVLSNLPRDWATGM
ncbi:M24 family metallopeptidase [Limnoglobus roseus]|uniref:Aminopeptidase P family protein n=1 Tax=Limnoglobus roseus TaxID=2598579 RepID=A0A5C1A8X5_9BACT|nr:Xaa-Pro peptidase family protein [Limnoglobus roseus]QEL15150.1 aminopeptidase P family protein [Limnoglobus roseus]